MSRLAGVLGILVILGIAWLVSENRRSIRWRTVGWGLGLQVIFALFILKTSPGRLLFDVASTVVNRILAFTDAGASFVFGNLYRATPEIARNLGPGTMTGHVQVVDGATGGFVDLGVILFIHILPTIIFFSSFIAVLYHLGIMTRLVSATAWIMRRTMKTSGSETLSAAANIFVGMTEAPLVVRPFVPRMTRSELMAIMVGGFATIAGGVMAAYVRFGIDAGHLLTASVMSAPAGLLVSKLMVPETADSETAGYVKVKIERESVNVIDAAAGGALVGLRLAANVGAMLLAFIALIAMIDFLLAWAGAPLSEAVPALAGLSLARLLGWILAPVAFLLGVPWSEAGMVGSLLGTKIAVNEFLAYARLAGFGDALSEKSTIIATYALCGFANFGSIAIQIGGIGGLAPGRRQDLARLGLRAMFAGALASWLTACLAGILIG